MLNLVFEENYFYKEEACNLKPFSITTKPLKNATFFNPCN